MGEPMGEHAGKYLTFALAGEQYGLSVTAVREIIRMTDITPVPQVPSHVRGVINLRGKVVPIVDLRLTFGYEAEACTQRTCIIVADVRMGGHRRSMGVIVDHVSEVLNITRQEIEPMPDVGRDVDTRHLKALAKVKGAVIVLIDLDRVLGGRELAIA